MFGLGFVFCLSKHMLILRLIWLFGFGFGLGFEIRVLDLEPWRGETLARGNIAEGRGIHCRGESMPRGAPGEGNPCPGEVNSWRGGSRRFCCWELGACGFETVFLLQRC